MLKDEILKILINNRSSSEKQNNKYIGKALGTSCCNKLEVGQYKAQDCDFDVSESDKIEFTKGNYISGAAICSKLGVSRTTVCRIVKKLKDEGYNIESSTKKGYRIIENTVCQSDMLNKAELEHEFIKAGLYKQNDFEHEGEKYIQKSEFKSLKIFYTDEIDSTNTWAKKLAEETGIKTIVCISASQTKGYGRHGNTWVSPHGQGIYLSIVLHPEICTDKLPVITLAAALAAAEAIRECSGVNALIKWPNDIVFEGKKLGGILTEMAADMDGVRYVVCGIGINVNNDTFKDGNLEYAVSLFNITKKKYSRKKLICDITKKFLKYSDAVFKSGNLQPIKEKYKSLLVNIGKTVRISEKKGEFEALSEGINDEGCLIVLKNNNERVCIVSGDVSVRGIYGYV